MDLSEVRQRTPILDANNAQQFPIDQIEKQWRWITEQVRQKITRNQKLREVATQFADIPVGESLPGKFLAELAKADEGIAEIRDEFRTVVDYLNLPPVPEHHIGVDIRYASVLVRPKDVAGAFQDMYGDAWLEELKKDAKRGSYDKGTTAHERRMIKKRHVFARDVKMLTLMAEMVSQEPLIGENKEITLPSGITIMLHQHDSEALTLLNPHEWYGREQLKDRVYKIRVESNLFLLKEKKTGRHVDTKMGGHKDGLSSREELEVAKYFQHNGYVESLGVDVTPLRQRIRLLKKLVCQPLNELRNIMHSGLSTPDRYEVAWEEPIAYVIFPDGFQFTVFKYMDNLLSSEELTQKLAQEIIKHRVQFEKDYKNIRHYAGRYYNVPPNFLSKKKGFWQTCFNGVQTRNSLILPFEDYAMAKAYRMEQKACELMEKIITKNGFQNSDTDGYSFQITSSNEGVQLRIFGFDFEYFFKIPEGEVAARLEREHEIRKGQLRRGIDFANWSGDDNPVTKMQKAAYLAILKHEGVLEA